MAAYNLFPEQVETAVYKHVRSYYYRNSAYIGYYRENGNLGEIDVVVDYPGGRILIEVKYRESYSLDVKAAIVAEAGKSTSALLITKTENDFGPLQSDKAIYKIPAYAFLYLLGHAERHAFAY